MSSDQKIILPLSKDQIYEFSEILDEEIPQYSEKEGNIVMSNGATTREYVLTKKFMIKNQFNPNSGIDIEDLT